MPQTTKRFEKSVLFGSAKIEIDGENGQMVDIGALNDVTFSESWETQNVTSQNAGVIDTRKINHQVSVTSAMLEVHPDLHELIRGQLDQRTTEAGTLVSDATQTLTSYSYDTFIPLENQNGDGTRITPTSIQQGPEGSETNLSEGTDYIVLVDAFGRSGITMFDTVDTDNTARLVITYDYTPVASTTFTTGQNVSIPARRVRLTHETPGRQRIVADIPFSKIQEGINFTFTSDTEGGEPISTNFNFMGTVDPATSTLYSMRFENL